jgi:hypothetical protein
MKAVSVELVPRDFSSVTLGVVAISVMSIAPCASSCAPLNAVTAIGTSSRLLLAAAGGDDDVALS